MASRSSWIVWSIICLSLLSGCTAMAGNVEHWPASLPALGVMFVGKLANDRYRLVKWPMEFLLWAAVVLVFFNLTYLHFKPF